MKTKQSATRYLDALLTNNRGLGLAASTVEISAHEGDPAESPEMAWDGYKRAVLPRSAEAWKSENGIGSNVLGASFGVNRSKERFYVGWVGLWIDGELQNRTQLSEVLEISPQVRLDIEPGNIVLIEE